MPTDQVKKIGKYEVMETLGKGGMGVVYKAVDPRIGRPVAIKMMTSGFAENADLLQRFYREAQSTGMLHHSNIVIVHDLGDVDGIPYLVMEYLEGEALDKMIAARRKIALVQKLDIVVQLLDGLQYAHERSIVHRDIKPANIMVLKDNTVKIVDFGIARLGDNSLTRTGQIVGTVNYMSPEQINNQVVDRRSDVFSAGVVLYELLTYTLPFAAPDTAGTLLKIISEPPPPLAPYLSDPEELEEIVHRALAKDRDDRYQSAEDFSFDLSRAQEKLKRLLVSEQVEQARLHVQKQELPKAKEILQQVLRLESHHLEAKDLLAEVQKQLQHQHRSEQIRQLRAHAEEAFSRDAFAEALSSVDQALALEKFNPDMIELRSKIDRARQRKEKAEEALRKAEMAHQAGKLESAVQILQQALQNDPSDTAMKAMFSSLSNELAEHQHQQKVQTLLDQARQEISMRKFSQALDLLKEVQRLDPNAPEGAALLSLANAGREQERKRRELQQATSEIEDALSTDDYQRALSRADAALQQFPSDPGLLKLKTIAEKQREAGDRKRFIEDRSAAARKLLDGGRGDEALKVLEEAAQQMPGDPRLQSLLAIVRDTVERQAFETKKSKVIQEAKDSLRRKDYAGAVKLLENAKTQLESAAEIQELLAFAREEATQYARRQQIDAAVEEAQKSLRDGEYEQAVVLLRNKNEQFGDDELSILLAQAERQVQELNRKIDSAISRSKQLLQSHNPEAAVELLESCPKHFARSQEFVAALERARAEQEKARALAGALAKAKAAYERGEFQAAMQIVESCKANYGDTPDVAKTKAEIEKKRASVAKSALERAVRDARTLMLARQYAGVRKTLDAAAEWMAFGPAELKSQVEGLKAEAERSLERQKKSTELDKTIISAGTPTTTLVAGSYEAPQEAAPTIAVPQAAAAKPAPAKTPSKGAKADSKETKAPATDAPLPPVAAPAKRSIVPIAIGAVAVVLAVVGIFAFRNTPSVATPPAKSAYVEINAVPWGTVKYLEPANGGARIQINEPTPVRVAVIPGEYKVVIAGPDGTEKADQVKAADGIPGNSTKTVFEQIDVDQILKQH